MPSPQDIVRDLQARLMRSAVPWRCDRVMTGCDALDRLLPGTGFCRGTLVEWLGQEACGATALAMLAAREACRDGRALVVVDRACRFYPPAAAAWGVNLEHLVVVRPTNQRDDHWAMTQALRSPAVGAVVCWPTDLDDRTFRRWQLAAERGGSLGLLVRPASAASQPSWAALRLHVSAIPSRKYPRMKVELLRNHGGRPGKGVELECNEEMPALSVLGAVGGGMEAI